MMVRNEYGTCFPNHSFEIASNFQNLCRMEIYSPFEFRDIDALQLFVQGRSGLKPDDYS